MNYKTAENTLKACFYALLIYGFAYYSGLHMEQSLKTAPVIQDLKQELALTKVEAKQKCNERFLGVKNGIRK